MDPCQFLSNRLGGRLSLGPLPSCWSASALCPLQVYDGNHRLFILLTKRTISIFVTLSVHLLRQPGGRFNNVYFAPEKMG